MSESTPESPAGIIADTMVLASERMNPPVPIDITSQLTGFVKALARFRREQEAFLNNGQGADYNTALTRYSHEQAALINAQDALLQAFGVT